MRSIDQSFYKSTRWKKTRKLYALSKYCICEECGKPVYLSGVNDYVSKEKRVKGIVHHKIHLNKDNYTNDEIAYGFDNLELVCIDDHNKIHFEDEVIRKEYKFDDNGNLVSSK